MVSEAPYSASFKGLKALARDIFIGSGLPPDDAELVADALVTADLRGTNSHGMIRLPFYVKRLLDGGTKAKPDIRVLVEGPSYALVDGDNGMGQVVAAYSMRMTIGKAKASGTSFVTARNSSHFGAAAYYSMMAVNEGMIGIAATNGPPVMAPWGGREARIGNNPISVAVPSGHHGPIVLDMAMSVVAGGKVRLAAKKGEKIPLGWVVNREGKATEDPNDLPSGGALLPLGYKGFGLAVALEILCGALSGARVLDEIPEWFKATGDEVGNGHMFAAIDISRFCEVESFKSRVDHIVEALKDTPLMEGFEEILMPGEPEARMADMQSKSGIALPEPVVRDLISTAESLGVAVPEGLFCQKRV